MASIYDRTPGEIQRRADEQRMVQEGMVMWSNRKLELLQQKIQEQNRLREMLNKYYPWGRPGGGAPNNSVRLRNIRENELIPEEDNRRQDALRIGGGPGGGAPRVTPTGHNRVVTIKEDPMLRFQHGDTVRRVVENKLRYRTDHQQQALYRRQLDAIVAEQRKARKALEKDKLEYARQLERQPLPWGRSGPGGRPWRPSPNTGSKFFKSLGWTTEDTLKLMEKENFPPKKNAQNVTVKPANTRKLCKIHEDEINNNCNQEDTRQSTGEVTGGVELVPLLAKRRAAAIRLPLVTTDVTRIPENPRWKPAGPEYLEALSEQVQNKNHRLKAVQHQDLESSKRHFETWDSFWGKPGHGAPRADNNQKRQLDTILYKMSLKS